MKADQREREWIAGFLSGEAECPARRCSLADRRRDAKPSLKRKSNAYKRKVLARRKIPIGKMDRNTLFIYERGKPG